jgi:hypothetical protein
MVQTKPQLYGIHYTVLYLPMTSKKNFCCIAPYCALAQFIVVKQNDNKMRNKYEIIAGEKCAAFCLFDKSSYVAKPRPICMYVAPTFKF